MCLGAEMEVGPKCLNTVWTFRKKKTVLEFDVAVCFCIICIKIIILLFFAPIFKCD